MAKTLLKKEGLLQAFNISPKGAHEGFLLDTRDGQRIQINFGRHLNPDFAAEGSEIRVDLEPEKAHEHACHPVFRLMSVAVGGDSKLPIPTARQPRNLNFSGEIKRLNYALHGAVNGAVLENGDFLHVKPHEAAKLNLKVGMKVKGIGSETSMADGHHVIEAAEVNGMPIEKKLKLKKTSH